MLGFGAARAKSADVAVISVARIVSSVCLMPFAPKAVCPRRRSFHSDGETTSQSVLAIGMASYSAATTIEYTFLMNSRSLLWAFFCLALSIRVPSALAADALPNVVLIMADDLG